MVEPYIGLDLNIYIKYALTRLRFGVSDITVHRSRYRVHNDEEIKCPLCQSPVDNEVRFVLR